MTSLSWIVVDFETASAVDLKRSGAARYAEDPTTEVLCCGYSIMGQEPGIWKSADGKSGPLWEAVNDPKVTFIAHNVAFEKAIWKEIMATFYGWPEIPEHRWHDTMATCAMKVLPLKLEQAIIALRLPFQKDMEGSRLVKSLSKPKKKTGAYDRSPETLERTYAYCGDDIRAETGLHERVGFLSPGERKVWLLDQRINQRGIRLDLDFVRAAQQVVDRASAPLAREFKDITRGLEFTQRDKIMAWLDEEGVRLPDMRKETLAAVLGENVDEADFEEDPGALQIELPDHVRRALHIRQLIGSASVKKLKAMEDCVCSDGIARNLLQYHGAGPGRWSGRLLQPQNFPRGELMLDGAPPDPHLLVDAIMTGDPDHVEMLFGPPVECVVASLRHALIPRMGRMFVSGDFSTIELRVNLALAGQRDKIDLIATGADPYLDMAKSIYKRALTKADKAERQVGKSAVLGLGFQMGPPRFKATAAKAGSTLETEECQEIVRIFRKEWAPEIPRNWYDLEAAAVRTVHDRTPHEARGVRYELEDGWLTARLPSGRKLWYYNPRPTRKAMPWDETDIRLAFTYQAVKQGRLQTLDAYGGLLTENVVQALARDLMVAAMFRLEKEGYPVVLTVHDEIVTEPEEWSIDELAFRQIMCELTPWAKELSIPIATETWVGDRYKK